MDRKYQVFFASLILTISSALQYSVNPFIRVYLMDMGDQGYEFYRSLFSILGYILSVLTIYLGYRLGKGSDLKNEYRVFIQSLVAGWFASVIVLGGFYLLSNDDTLYMLEFASTHGIISGYSVGATLFASIFIGWVSREGFDLKREFNPVILKPVLVYRAVILVLSICGLVVSLQSISGANHSSIALLMNVIGWIRFPFWIYYASRMLSSGRLVDLENDYGSVLYTIWLPSFIVSSVNYLLNVVFYYLRSGNMYDLFEIPRAYGLKILSSFFGIFSLPLALLCYSYLSSKYRYISKLNTSEESIEQDS